jgi:hypothetical protein
MDDEGATTSAAGRAIDDPLGDVHRRQWSRSCAVLQNTSARKGKRSFAILKMVSDAREIRPTLKG